MNKPSAKSHTTASRGLASFGSMQTRLSDISSEQRLRNPAFAEKNVKSSTIDLENNDDAPEEQHSRPLEYETGCIYELFRKTAGSWSKNPYLAFCLTVYCSLSAVVFTCSIIVSPAAPDSMLSINPYYAGSASPLENLQVDQFLSKLSSVYPQPRAFLPNVLENTTPSTTGVSACLWTNEVDVYRLSTWMTRWIGSISLVVTTSSEPSSSKRETLLHSFAKFNNNASLNRTLSIHLLQVDKHAPYNPNAYLNLARLFAPSPQVVLFPGNLSIVPPKSFYRSFFSNTSASARNVSLKPVLFTSRGQATFPFSTLSPVVLNRDDPLWCTERSFLSISREADWNDCLWQLWLEHFSNMDLKQTSDWVHPFVPEPDFNLLPAKLRRRLTGKFRSETCSLATRRLAALRDPENGSKDAKKARWLKQQCREWMTLA